MKNDFSTEISELPEKEQIIYTQLQNLSKSEKRVLWNMIKNITKDGIVVYPVENEITKLLQMKKIIYKNTIYEGKGYSFRVLPDAPHLLRRLNKFYSRKNIGLNYDF